MSSTPRAAMLALLVLVPGLASPYAFQSTPIPRSPLSVNDQSRERYDAASEDPRLFDDDGSHSRDKDAYRRGMHGSNQPSSFENRHQQPRQSGFRRHVQNFQQQNPERSNDPPQHGRGHLQQQQQQQQPLHHQQQGLKYYDQQSENNKFEQHPRNIFGRNLSANSHRGQAPSQANGRYQAQERAQSYNQQPLDALDQKRTRSIRDVYKNNPQQSQTYSQQHIDRQQGPSVYQQQVQEFRNAQRSLGNDNSVHQQYGRNAYGQTSQIFQRGQNSMRNGQNDHRLNELNDLRQQLQGINRQNDNRQFGMDAPRQHLQNINGQRAQGSRNNEGVQHNEIDAQEEYEQYVYQQRRLNAQKRREQRAQQHGQVEQKHHPTKKRQERQGSQTDRGQVYRNGQGAQQLRQDSQRHVEGQNWRQQQQQKRDPRPPPMMQRSRPKQATNFAPARVGRSMPEFYIHEGSPRLYSVLMQRSGNVKITEKVPGQADHRSLARLDGHTVGDGKYLLVEAIAGMNPEAKSAICRGYLHSGDGIPTGNPFVIKISKNLEQLEREVNNFDMFTSDPEDAQMFVQVFDYLPDAQLYAQELHPMFNETYSYGAIIMEEGSRDLWQFLRQNGPLKGPNLRDVALMIARITEAFHLKSMVWTEIKPNNFVICRNGLIKAIDLESAVPVNGRNRDYTPQAIPPEYAKALTDHRVPLTLMRYSYDIWSFGMILYELALGRNYFDGVGGDQIIEDLAKMESVNLEDLSFDPDLMDLVDWCLQIRPEDRPTIAQVIEHEYFQR